MGARILVVEADEGLSRHIKCNLEVEGYKVDLACRAEEADLKLREQLPDLLLLDWMLPDLSGHGFCRRLRARAETKSLPIILLTARAIMLMARGEENDRFPGSTTGADDYIVKPFSVPELIVHVDALLRGIKPALVGSVIIRADIALDPEQRKVTRSKREIVLGPTEYHLLEFLMQSPEQVFSRRKLLEDVWKHDANVDERTVDVYIGRLRKSLNLGTEADPIRTVRGLGYSFREQNPARPPQPKPKRLSKMLAQNVR